MKADAGTASDTGFFAVAFGRRTLEIEFAWVGPNAASGPTMVFLHEGLGSLSMWRDFPDALCRHLGMRGFVFSRPGYGRSTPRAPAEHWTPDFMHRQAHELLPRVFEAAGLVEPWLFGHSDGGSIALLHAARFRTSGLIVMAPHVFVEDVSIASIEQAREAYETTDLRQRLARHHADVDSAFRGWNDAWLSPDFRDWNIVDELGTIGCPILAVQGVDDAYGTLAQIRSIARVLPKQTRLLELAACGHSPHRDQPEAVMREVAAFVRQAAAA